MKKLFIIIAAIALFSCEKEEIKDPIKIDITGQWNVIFENGMDVRSLDWYYVFDKKSCDEYERGVLSRANMEYTLSDDIVVINGDVFDCNINGDYMILDGKKKLTLKR